MSTPVRLGRRETVRAAMQTGAGSSAGGKQAKLLAESAERGHLLVKFAPVKTRSADLLVMEELALASIAESGIEASRATALMAGEHVYLEVERFDRIGRFGRRGFISAGALDDELFGRRDRWSAFAQRCLAARMLDREAVDVVSALSAYSELIGNTDTHFENLSLLTDERGRPVSIAPAYDLLPSRYAPLGSSIDPALTPIEPALQQLGARPEIWQLAFDAANRFWERSAADTRLSGSMRQLARANLGVVHRFVEPLL